MKRKMLLFALVLPAILSQNIQAQTSSRLTAQSDWVNNGIIFTPVDSSYFNYSSGRGGDLTHTLKYDNATKWVYVDSSTGYENFNNYIQTFDANNNITSITYQYWDGSEWVLSTKTLYTYNSSNQVTTMTMQTWGGSSFVPVSQDAYSYNAAGKMYLDIYGVWDALTLIFDMTSQKTYIYDPTNTYVVNETDETYVSGSPVYTNKYDYNYTSGQLINVITSTWNGSAWIGNNMITYSYDGSGNILNRLYQLWDALAGTFDNDSLNIYSYAGGTMPQTNIVQTWNDSGSGSWNNIMEYVYSYNGSNQLTQAVGTAWNVVGIFEHASGDPMSSYYYSSYTSGVSSVKNISNNGGTANIYPVPTQNMLHIDLTWNVAQTATITIYDMQGSVVRQWDAPSGTQYNSAIPVNGFADGNYFVQVNGEQGQIVKQFVVTH